MDGESQFREELGHRDNQILNLRQELFDWRDRIEDGKERCSQLEQGICRLQAEIGIRRAKSNELEDKVALKELEGENAVRDDASDAVAAAARVSQLQADIAQTRDSCRKVTADINKETTCAADLQIAVTSTGGRLDALRRDVSREQQQFQQEEASEEQRQAELEKEQKQLAANNIQHAKNDLASEADNLTSCRSEVSRLETGLAMEKECCDGLDTALQHAVERHETAKQECVALQEVIDAQEAKDGVKKLQEALATSRQQAGALQRQVAAIRQSANLRTQSMQGALSETRRMMTDHLNQTRKVTSDPSVDYLLQTLSEWKSKVDSGAAAHAFLQEQCDSLQAAVHAAENEVSKAEGQASKAEYLSLKEELRALTQEQDSISRRCAEARGRGLRAQAAKLEMERSARETELLLRRKLEELWYNLRQRKNQKS